MKTTFAILLLFMSLNSHALIYFDLQGEFHIGGIDKFDEAYQAGQDLEHDAWTIGTAIGARAGLSIGPFFFGGTGNYGKLQFEGERQDAFIQNGFDGAEDYDNAIERKMFGGFFGIRTLLNMHIIGEYYKEVSGRVSYAEPRGENLFAHGDRLKGTGWALGIGGQVEFVSGNLLFRRITYDRLVLSNAKVDLPSAQIKDKISTNEVVIQFGMTFDAFRKRR